MTVVEMAMWLAGVHLAGVAAGRVRPVVPHFGSLTMYRRDGGSITMPRPGTYRATALAPFPLFDAVIVPSARGAEALLRAARTARNADATLVVLASGRTTARATRLLLGEDRCLVLETPPGLGGPMLRTFHHPCATTTTDISRKRNDALVFARRNGWRTVLFVDDDVQTIGQQDLRYASDLLAGADRGGIPRRMVGWAFDEFGDFSVVGHARRRETRGKVSYVGGGAMAITCDSQAPFFPPVYNEDLLAGLTMLADDPTSVCVAGTLGQDAYAPFADPARASAQEFGEVLTEGYGRRHDPAELRNPRYWESVLQDRRRLVQEAEADLEQRGVTDGASAMRAVLAAHRPDWPELLAGFVDDWAHDRSVWREHLSSSPG
ncbi:hypothetical protein [Amycolatopsis sp. NPDC004169]|uniref:hypothetical protein n=1 Tax=Amycolatopsis sp. NPDC004169 TaxID=3154453 RepID=UPI0033B07B03